MDAPKLWYDFIFPQPLIHTTLTHIHSNSQRSLSTSSVSGRAQSTVHRESPQILPTVLLTSTFRCRSRVTCPYWPRWSLDVNLVLLLQSLLLPPPNEASPRKFKIDQDFHWQICIIQDRGLCEILCQWQKHGFHDMRKTWAELGKQNECCLK